MRNTAIAIALFSLLSLLPLAAHAAPQPTDAKTMSPSTSFFVPAVKPVPSAVKIQPIKVEPMGFATCAKLAGSVDNETWMELGCNQKIDLD